MFVFILQMDHEWMYMENRVTTVYLQGVAGFLAAAKQNVINTKEPWVLCPCCDCKNTTSFKDLGQIQTHLIKRGFVPGYECWSHHGEVEQITEEGDDAYDEEQISVGESHASTDDDVLMYEVDTTTIFPST